MDEFVPADFEIPAPPVAPEFFLEPLTPAHNERDHEAWTSSMDHIHRTPGFEGSTWPRPMTLEENRGDLVRHAEDFEARKGFTYSVLAGEDVVGCVYIYPGERPGWAQVRSWVRADRAHLDEPLYATVKHWLDEDWPFAGYTYAPRSGPVGPTGSVTG